MAIELTITPALPPIERQTSMNPFKSGSVEKIKASMEVSSREPYMVSAIDILPKGVKRVEGHEVRTYGWHKEINIDGKIIGVTSESVICDCLIDPDSDVFEVRHFPKLLFSHLHELKEEPFVYITIRTRPGTTRIDVRDGSKLVNRKAFMRKESWEGLKVNLFDKRISKPLKFDVKD